jgi:hypothetical protein
MQIGFESTMLLSLFLFLSTLKLCICWWGHGHLLVAEIAVAHLNKTDPQRLEIAMKMVTLIDRSCFTRQESLTILI